MLHIRSLCLLAISNKERLWSVAFAPQSLFFKEGSMKHLRDATIRRI